MSELNLENRSPRFNPVRLFWGVVVVALVSYLAVIMAAVGGQAGGFASGLMLLWLASHALRKRAPRMRILACTGVGLVVLWALRWALAQGHHALIGMVLGAAVGAALAAVVKGAWRWLHSGGVEDPSRGGEETDPQTLARRLDGDDQ